MNYLAIHFAEAELGEFRWALLDSTAKSVVGEWQLGTQAELPVIAAQHRDPVILLLPQQCVYMTQVSLPNKASRQVLSAIEFQVEDQLARDIETQHFALGNTASNPIAIAVVDRDIMDRSLSLARAHGLRIHQILPEMFLCPWKEGGMHMLEGYNGYLLRYGEYQGMKCSAAALESMLPLLKRDHEFDSVTFYSDSGESNLPEIDGIVFERQSLASQAPGLFDGPLINLQQRDYAQSSAWKSVAKAWKWMAILFATLIVLATFNRAVALQQLEAEVNAIRQQQYQLLKDYLPADARQDDNLKKLVIERLKLAQTQQGEQGFISLLLDFTQAKKQYAAVNIARVSYQNKRLSIDISSQQLNDIEALHRAVLARGGIAAQLESLNIKPDIISARLVMMGEPNG